MFDILKRAADLSEKFAVLWQHKRIVSNSSVELNGRIRIPGGHHLWSSLQIRWWLISDLMLADLCYRFDAGWYWCPLQIRCCSTDATLADLRYRSDAGWYWCPLQSTDSMLAYLHFRFFAVWSPLHILVLSSFRYIIDSMLANLCSDSMLTILADLSNILADLRPIFDACWSTF